MIISTHILHCVVVDEDIVCLSFFIATELSNLNIQSTRLQQQITPLSGRADKLSGELALLQEQVERRREERAKNAPKNVGQMKSELEKLHKELEVSREDQ